MLKLLHFTLLTIGGLTLPRLGQAQFAKRYASGAYALASDSLRPLAGQLRLKSQRKLVVITPAGHKLKFGPKEVNNFQIGSRSYTVVRDVVIAQGSRVQEVQAAFAERIDSGRITLWRYTHLWNTGSGWLFLYRYPLSFYLAAGLGPHLIAIHDRGDPGSFRQQALPLLQQQPDLVHLLDEGRITYANLPNLIRTINAGIQFTSPAPPNLK